MDSSVAWLWAIEYLASFHQIEPSILHDLIDEAPELPEDLGKNAREMVALKCLEHLFSSNANDTASATGVPSAVNQNNTFDIHESCEDVLQSILKETSVSDLKMAGPDLLKWDIRPFILQKRASMPKCALEQLKDAILEGTHSYAASLRELSGLVHKNDENDRIIDNHGMVGSSTYTQIIAPKESNIHLALENKDQMVGGNSSQKSLLPLKRSGADLGNGHPDGDYEDDHCGMNYGDLHLNAKRSKHKELCANNKSQEQILIPDDGNGLMEESFEMTNPVTERESCHVARDSQGVGLGECLENHHEKLDATERLGRSPTAFANDDFQHNQCDNVSNASKMPQNTPGDEAHQCNLVDEVNEAEPRASNGESSLRSQEEVSVDDSRDNHDCSDQIRPQNVVSLGGFSRGFTVEKSKGGTENLCQTDTSSESDGYHHEKIDVAMEKSHFLSSHCTLSHVSPSDWTELNCCVQCSKDGQLLVCNAVGCPFVVHENCLGYSPEFDEKGNFYCPFCAYSYAISKYLEAKEKATLARKELAAFINNCSKKSHIQNISNLEQGRDEDCFDKIHEHGDLGQRESYPTNNEEHACKVNGLLKKTRGNKQSEEPLLDVNEMCREKEVDVTHGTTHISLVANGCEEMALERPSARKLDGQDQTSAGVKCHGDNPMSKDKDILSSNKKEAEEGILKELLDKQRSNLLEKPVYAGTIDEAETSDDENEENLISNYSIRLRRKGMRERQYVYPATPQLRRKKVPWTAKEEEMLKEGVQKFSNTGDRTIPWKKILEYGSSVFLGDRNTIDLKDKWRNICKGSPKCK